MLLLIFFKTAYLREQNYATKPNLDNLIKQNLIVVSGHKTIQFCTVSPVKLLLPAVWFIMKKEKFIMLQGRGE